MNLSLAISKEKKGQPSRAYFAHASDANNRKRPPLLKKEKESYFKKKKGTCIRKRRRKKKGGGESRRACMPKASFFTFEKRDLEGARLMKCP